MIEKHEGKHILLVTHAGVIRVILMYILGMQEENLFRLNVDYASISTIRMYHDDTGEWGTLISHGRHSV
jgi:broad specificity phosphatase PhoE